MCYYDDYITCDCSYSANCDKCGLLPMCSNKCFLERCNICNENEEPYNILDLPLYKVVLIHLTNKKFLLIPGNYTFYDYNMGSYEGV